MPSTSFSRSGDVDSRDSIRCQPFASSTASWVLSVRGHAKWGRTTTGHSSRKGTCWRRSHASRTPATTVQSISPVIHKPTLGSRTARHDANAQVTVTAASIVSILESNVEPHQLNARRASSAYRDHGSVRGSQLPPSSSHRTKAERRSEASFASCSHAGPAVLSRSCFGGRFCACPELGVARPSINFGRSCISAFLRAGLRPRPTEHLALIEQ